MKFAVLSSAVLFATLAHAQNPDPFINTPNGVTQCEISALTFGGTHPPWVISAIPGGAAGSAPIETIVTTSVSPYSWLVNLAQGSYITLQIRDSAGSLQYSSPITVLNSSNSSCVGSGGGGATVTNSPTQPLSTSTTSSSSDSSGTRPGTTSKPTGTTTSPTTSPTSSKGAASQIQAQIGLAFVLSLVGAVAMM